MSAASQATTNYTHDNANRLTAITQGSETVKLAYDADNRRTTLTLPNGITVNYGYDTANELTGMTYNHSNGTTLGNLGYTYDSTGRIVSKGGTFATDVLPTATTQVSTFDLNDRQKSFNGQALSYDANGNLTGDGTNTYTWNARNQLTKISQGGTTQLTYAYDAMGRRTSKIVGTRAPTQYLYDDANAVQETQGSTVNPILVGLNMDERFARNDASGRAYFLTDALNSTIALTSTTGAIQNLYSYDPYGNTSQSGIGFTNPYQYTGREADSPGLYYYRARYYSPAMCGFISEDSAGFGGGQPSFYAYVGGNPLSNTDPMGLESSRAASGCGTMSWAACGSFPLTIPSCTEPCGCGPRVPDFVSFNINAYVFSVFAAYSEDGSAFVGGGVNFNMPNPVNLDASANAGWLNSTSPSSDAQIDDFLNGYSGEVAGAYSGVGGGEAWSPGNGTATMVGFGAGESYQTFL